MKKAPLLALLALSFVVAGCSNVVTASRDKPIDDNRGTRTLGSTVDDALIETKAAVNIAKANPGLADLQRSSSYIGLGPAPRPAPRDRSAARAAPRA